MVNNEWFIKNRSKALEGLKKLAIKRYMEIKVELSERSYSFSDNELKKAAKMSQIHYFGWPIGAVLDQTKYRPHPDEDGIFAEISIGGSKDVSYDYWAIHKNGSFYLLKSLFEDRRKPEYIFFNTRIVRITEALLYLSNLYSNLKVDKNLHIKIAIKHAGLKGSKLGVAGSSRLLLGEYKIYIEEVSSPRDTTIDSLNANIVDEVEFFTKELFEKFDFFELDRGVLEDIVNRYIQGEVS